MNWLEIENTAVKWENTVLISTVLYLEGRPFFSRYQYEYCKSNTTLDKIVVNCFNAFDLPYKKNKRPEEATIDCFDSFEVRKSFTARKYIFSLSTFAWIYQQFVLY